MKRMGKAGFMGLMVIFLSVLTIGGLAGNAAAVTFTLGTMTGNGIAYIGTGGTLTDWSFSGQFNFDTTDLGGGQSLATIFGDVGQFHFVANSSGTVPASDYSAPWNPANGPEPTGYTTGSVSKGTCGWEILNTTGNGSTLYGSVLNFGFSGGNSETGTVTGAVKSSDGNIHWYYGFDTFAGPPRGMTPLAALLVNDTFNMNGNYAFTVDHGSSIEFSLTNGTVTGTQVPLPPSALLLGSGLLGLVGLGWRRARKES